jgi:hypothetical protein
MPVAANPCRRWQPSFSLAEPAFDAASRAVRKILRLTGCEFANPAFNTPTYESLGNL